MPGEHPWVTRLRALRSGQPLGPVGLERLTANQRAGHLAVNLESARRGHAEVQKTVVDALEDLERERMRGLFGGESLATYGTLHMLARAASLDAVLDLRRRYDSKELVRLHSHLLGWWQWVASLCLAWRGETGIVRCVGPRYKTAPADVEKNLRGGDILVHWLVWRELRLHPFLRKKLLETPLDDDWYVKHRPHERLLSWSLGSWEVGRYLRGRIPPAVPATRGRLVDDTYWRRAGGLEVLSPTVTALKDTDGKGRRVDRYYAWDRSTRQYRTIEGRASVAKEVSACWYVAEDPAGRLVRHVWYRTIHGVRQREQLPSPEEIPTPDSTWEHAGPLSEPYPLPDAPPWTGDGGLNGGNGGNDGGKEEEGVPNKMIPRWKIKSWIKDDAPSHVRTHLADIAWQAQRLRDGEPKARERLERAVDALRKGETP